MVVPKRQNPISRGQVENRVAICILEVVPLGVIVVNEESYLVSAGHRVEVVAINFIIYKIRVLNSRMLGFSLWIWTLLELVGDPFSPAYGVPCFSFEKFEHLYNIYIE